MEIDINEVLLALGKEYVVRAKVEKLEENARLKMEHLYEENARLKGEVSGLRAEMEDIDSELEDILNDMDPK